jgi:uncharacterized protein with NRDE domain
MCTFVILRRPGSDWPVLIAANRDEMLGRPWLPPSRHWPDRAQVVAGKDELAGGSWLGINNDGVVAGILNRFGTLGPAPGQRSRGELVLEALDHADAADAAKALAAIDPRAYRTFNLIIADDSGAFWLRHADESGRQPVSVTPLKPGLSMIAAGELDDSTPRLTHYRPRFLSAAIPDPASRDWRDWEKLLEDRGDAAAGPMTALNFATPEGFATVSGALIGLPSKRRAGIKPAFRFTAFRPAPTPWRDVLV